MTERERDRSEERCFLVLRPVRRLSRCPFVFVHGGIFVDPPMNE